MKTEIKINVRGYVGDLKDNRTGEQRQDGIFLTKEMIRAGALFDMSDEEIIYRRYNRQGFKVLEISKPRKVECTIDLADLVLMQDRKIMDLNALADLCTEGTELAQEYWSLEKQMEKLLDEAQELMARMGAEACDTE